MKKIRLLAILALVLVSKPIFGASSCPQPDSCCGSWINDKLYTWASYTYFFLDDLRPDNRSSGETHGQNVLLSGNYYFIPCASLGVYGIYQDTDTLTPPTQQPTFTERTRWNTKGGGIGTNLAYYMSNGPSFYIDYSYVWLNQRHDTDFGGLGAHGSNDGHRWQTSIGTNIFYPILGCANFAGNGNFQFIASNVAGSVDSLSVTLTGQDSYISIGSLSGALYLFPCCKVQPFVNTGLSYEITRSVGTPQEISSDASNPAIISLWDRFEWNLGAGALAQWNSFGFSISYLQKRRPGPIITDILNIYLSKNF